MYTTPHVPKVLSLTLFHHDTIFSQSLKIPCQIPAWSGSCCHLPPGHLSSLLSHTTDREKKCIPQSRAVTTITIIFSEVAFTLQSLFFSMLISFLWAVIHISCWSKRILHCQHIFKAADEGMVQSRSLMEWSPCLKSRQLKLWLSCHSFSVSVVVGRFVI